MLTQTRDIWHAWNFGHLAPAQLFHHFLHLTELLNQIIDIAHFYTAALSNAASAAGIQQFWI